MASDEILIKVAADLTDLKEGFANNDELWRKHNENVAKGEKAIKTYAETTVNENKKVNKALQGNIDKVAAEGKAVQNLEKKFESLNKKNEKSFDTKKLKNFNTIVNEVSKNIGNLDQFDIDTEDMEYLTKSLSEAQDDFEALNVLVDFFENKMKSSAVSVSDSFDVIKAKIEETKLNVSSTEGFIKDIDKQIKTTAPGQDQANLISEREAAAKALREEKVSLADYQAQLKKAREENVSMATQLRKVKDELVQLEIAGERGGERWIELSKQAETYNTAIKSTNAEINRTASSTEDLDNLIGAATGIVGLFTAAQGATALFGDENEDLQKSLVKVTGAIALLNGLQQIQTELAKKETIAGKALTFVRAQYAVATDSGTKATLRLSAATKLLGIGLLVGALAAIVVYWKDIAKWIGITNEKTEAYNDINKKAIDSIGSEIGRLKSLQSELENTNTSKERQREIKKDLLEQYPTYLKALDDEKASAEDIASAFDNLNKALLLNAKLSAARELISDEFKKVLEAERKAIEGEASTFQEIVNASFVPLNSVIGGNSFDENNSIDAKENLAEAKKDYNDFEKFISGFITETNAELEKLGGDPTKDGEKFKNAVKEYEKFNSVLASLIDQQESYRIDAIENGREKEKELLKAKLNDEKEKYKKQIDDLKVSEERKAKLRAEFNKLYNEQTGVAYEQLRKDILKIDEKYDNELLSVKLKAQSAIDSVFKSETETERKAIQDKFKAIRDELIEQLKLTNDVTEKNKINVVINTINQSEEEELNTFDLNTDLDRIDRENEIAKTILAIQQANSKDIIKNEELKQLQLLNLQKNYLNEILDTYQDSFEDLDDQTFLNGLINTISTSVDNDAIQEAANKLRAAFGEDMANEILKTVEALKEVQNGINDIGSQSALGNTISEIAEWTSSLEGFGLKLGESLGLQGEAAQEFAEFTAQAISSVVDGLNDLFDAEIEQRRAKIDAIQESIDAVEQEVEREQELYEEGYANNYEARQEDLNNLKQQKKKEEEELKKAQKAKALIQNTENIANLAAQASNLITSVTEITKAHSGIPFVGVALAIGFIATMFGAIAQAKAQAQAISQGQNFRRGLQEGAVSLSGPRHEEHGFGLYNSKTGERIAEFEDGEKLYAVNKRQQNKYTDVLDAMVADSNGTGNLETFFQHKYKVDSVGSQSLKVIKQVNEITIKSQAAKQELSIHNLENSKDLKDIKKLLSYEFEGFKKSKDEEIKAWETKEFYHVKKGNVTKKYKK